MRIYLAGAINGQSDADCQDWRDIATQLLTDLGHTVVNPMRRDYRGRENEPGIASEIVLNDQHDILSCQAVLVKADRPSWGTAMEVYFAWMHAKIVVAYGAGEHPSPWLAYRTRLYATLDVAVAVIHRERP